MANGYVIESDKYTTHVTGIPFEADWTKSDYSSWTLLNCSDKGNNLEIASRKTGGVFSPIFKTPASTNINVKYEASSLATSSSNRKAYIAVVNSNETSLNTSNNENFQYHNEADSNSTYAYKTWSKTSLSINGSQKLSVAFYSTWPVYFRKCKVEYK